MADELELKGRIEKEYSAGRYKVTIIDEVAPEEYEATCQLSGRMDHYNIDVVPGDKVVCKFHGTDLTTGHIVERIDG